MITNVLVTGASGEIGGVVSRMLLEKEHKVRVLVRSEQKGAALKKLGAEIFIGDLTDSESIRRAVSGCEGVYHIAAVYRQAGLTDDVYFDVNTEGTRRMLNASCESGVKRFIHCSTGGVLGDVTNPPGSDKTPYNPGDVYQRSKTEAEKIALEYFRSGKIRGAVIRPAMVYGPGDTRHLKLFRMIAKGSFFYVGAGDKFVHFIDIRELAKAFLLAMEHEEINGEIYHVAGDRPRKLFEVVNLVADYLNVKQPWLHLPVKPTQMLGVLCETICTPLGIQPPIFKRRVDFFTKNRWFDTSKTERELGFKVSKPFEEELKEVIEWYQANGQLS